MAADPHVEASAADVAGVIAGLLPLGTAWPRDPDSDLMAWCSGNAEVWADVSAAAALLLMTESDPRNTVGMISDWESTFGLPDECVAELQTLQDRRNALLNRITAEGGQSRLFFIRVAARLGYTVTITEFSPFMAGISRAGDTRPLAPDDPTAGGYRWSVGAPEMRFYWQVHVVGAKTRWFRAGSGQAGVDPMVRIGLATDLECLFRRLKPAHTEIAFDYSTANPLAATYTWFRAGLSHAGTDPMLAITTRGGVQDT